MIGDRLCQESGSMTLSLDTTICPWLPEDRARIDLVVCEVSIP